MASIRSLAASLRLPPNANGDRLEELVRFATLAANSHNTQPWRFVWSDGVLRLEADRARGCPVVDPDHHHVFVSVGAAAHAACVAGPALGFEVSLIVEDEAIVASLREVETQEAPRLDALRARMSTRAPFDPAPVDEATRVRLAEAASIEDVTLRWIDGAELAALTESLAEATRAQARDAAFLHELRDWIRFSPTSALRTRDGLASEATGNPSAPDWIGRRVFRFAAGPGPLEKALRAQMAGTSAALVLCGPEDAPRGWMKVGRALQALLLEAEAAGLASAFVNQAIEVPTLRPAFERRFGVEGRRADVVLRLGEKPRGMTLAHSLRRPVSEVLVRR
ncbi:MAG: nitroreductase family protein [Sandaracinus sp.]|nr:nitroreductase family protein [Sandaracinus sp.]MCB9625562.1 nitroreductase family protein [Sandaracinus sp.]MCB9635522.1 nitroreductase family protein [Sandaracinus sp.]